MAVLKQPNAHLATPQLATHVEMVWKTGLIVTASFCLRAVLRVTRLCRVQVFMQSWLHLFKRGVLCEKALNLTGLAVDL